MQVKIKESNINNNITELVKSKSPLLKLQLILKLQLTSVQNGETITES